VAGRLVALGVVESELSGVSGSPLCDRFIAHNKCLKFQTMHGGVAVMKTLSPRRRIWPAVGIAAAGLLLATASAHAATAEQMAVAKKWLSEFQPSTLTQEEQLKELEWFIDAAEPFRGMNIKVVSETIPTHTY